MKLLLVLAFTLTAAKGCGPGPLAPTPVPSPTPTYQGQVSGLWFVSSKDCTRIYSEAWAVNPLSSNTSGGCAATEWWTEFPNLGTYGGPWWTWPPEALDAKIDTQLQELDEQLSHRSPVLAKPRAIVWETDVYSGCEEAAAAGNLAAPFDPLPTFVKRLIAELELRGVKAAVVPYTFGWAIAASPERKALLAERSAHWRLPTEPHPDVPGIDAYSEQVYYRDQMCWQRWLANLNRADPTVRDVVVQLSNCVASQGRFQAAMAQMLADSMRAKGYVPRIQAEACVHHQIETAAAACDAVCDIGRAGAGVTIWASYLVAQVPEMTRCQC